MTNDTQNDPGDVLELPAAEVFKEPSGDANLIQVMEHLMNLAGIPKEMQEPVLQNLRYLYVRAYRNEHPNTEKGD